MIVKETRYAYCYLSFDTPSVCMCVIFCCLYQLTIDTSSEEDEGEESNGEDEGKRRDGEDVNNKKKEQKPNETEPGEDKAEKNSQSKSGTASHKRKKSEVKVLFVWLEICACVCSCDCMVFFIYRNLVPSLNLLPNRNLRSIERRNHQRNQRPMKR